MNSNLDFLIENINLDLYPIHNKGCEDYKLAVSNFRIQLDEFGCAHLQNFIKDEKLTLIKEQSESVASLAHYHENEITPYATEVDKSLDKSHPINRLQKFSNGFVAKDLLPEEMIIKNLYKNDFFKSFIADCLDLDVIYEYEDPIAGLVINVMPEDTALPWHFDTNEFIVSLMTRKPESGGEFQYSPSIRQPGNENYQGVQEILDGDMSSVKSLTLDTGDLQLFKGRFSMHRVAPCKGTRLCALFGYSDKEGVMGRVKRTKDVYGRVTQAHIDAELKVREDGLAG
ncbi:HalD/BesD family halogenase [Marinomonas atlantica]|uniref:HalD/BesD family halogenase n=1 Tax=Marinomonas atlantica TaxID=1806668 RepID=UPI00082D51E2|nr:hypothetical protein [Marinomonas atlantica]